MFARRPGGRAPLARTRLRVEGLEAREVPALWMNYTGDFKAYNLDNWAFGAYEDTSQLRNIAFDAACTDECIGLAGSFDSVTINPGFSGRITLGGELIAVWLYQGNGIIDQPDGPATAITVTQWWSWEGGTLNSTETASSITVSGSEFNPATATISPAGAGTVETGSTITFGSFTTADINPGTISFARGLGMVVQNTAAVNVPLSYAAETTFSTKTGDDPHEDTRIYLEAGSNYRVFAQNDYTRVAVARTRLPISNSGGFLRIEMGANLTVAGMITSANQAQTYFGSVYQTSGATKIANGSSLRATNGVQISGGYLYTTTNPVLQLPQEQKVIIHGDLRVDQFGAGAATFIEIGIGVPGQAHVRGVLRVEGNIRWAGGTYRPVIDIANAQRADLWEATGTFTLGSGAVVHPTVENFNPALGIAADYRAKVLYAGLGFTGLNGADPPSPTLTLPAGVSLKWYKIDDTLPGRWYALGPT